VTCPPMVGLKGEFESMAKRLGWEVTFAKVTQTLTELELIGILPEFDGWIIGDDPASQKVVKAGAAGRLRAAVKWGAGTDNIDFAAFQDMGIPIDNTPGMFGDEVADVAIGYLIGISRHLFVVNEGVKSGKWEKPIGTSLRNKTIALVGYGDIGQQIKKRLDVMGCNVVVYDPYCNSDELIVKEWPDGLGDCAFIVFCCALTEENYHMLGEEIIEGCKDGVGIVNVARGGLIDEMALIDGLKSGKVSSVALDVFETEPLRGDSSLRDIDDCVFGTHNSSNTKEAVVRTSILAIQKLDHFLKEY
jgi:D-3-phosphoglycerate dehydrogenase / 2-oxoglutarate reductase